MTNEQKLTEFFATHPSAALLVPEYVYDEVAATGIPCCKSDLPGDQMYAVDRAALRCPLVMEPPEFHVRELTWWEKLWHGVGSVTSGCGRGNVEA